MIDYPGKEASATFAFTMATFFRWGRRVYNFLTWNFLRILYPKKSLKSIHF